jgi:hypothetical protein
MEELKKGNRRKGDEGVCGMALFCLGLLMVVDTSEVGTTDRTDQTDKKTAGCQYPFHLFDPWFLFWN